MNIPERKSPPGKAFKISWFQRFINWYWNWRHPFPKILPLEDLGTTQEIVNTMYNQAVDNAQRQFLPPMWKVSPKRVRINQLEDGQLQLVALEDIDAGDMVVIEELKVIK